MFVVDKITIPHLELSGLDPDLTEEERAIQQNIHRFAKEVMRPIGTQLDKMTPEEAVAKDSPIWDFYSQFAELGLSAEMLASLAPEDASRLLPIIMEELAWGDVGLGLSTMVLEFPAVAAKKTGDPEVSARFAGLRGSWLATQPDRGSDTVDFTNDNLHPGAKQAKGNIVATVHKDEIIINGQSSAWVSVSPIAECALAYLPANFGDGVIRPDGNINGIGVLVPFDLPGISKGQPLDKLGQRPLCQGEVFFEEVRIPRKYALTRTTEEYRTSIYGALTFGNMEMGLAFTGLARAAYEHALDYVHERRQGGTALINHQSVKQRLFGMWQKVEMARAISRRACRYNFLAPKPHLLASITSKTTVTQLAFEVASEALQLFGGNGLTKEYPLEKLFRDARASLIEDGENNILNLKGAAMLSQWYQEQQWV